MRSLVARPICLGFIIVTLSFFAGCGRGDAPDWARVTGTVTRGGKPVGDLIVNFVPDEGRPSWGLTDEQGRYKLYYTKEEDGARIGSHKVFVEFNQAQPASFAGDGQVHPNEGPDMHETLTEPGAPPPSPLKNNLTQDETKTIISKYGNLQTTPLRFEVAKDGQVVDIILD